MLKRFYRQIFSISVVKEFSANGYHVIVDGIVGPWFIESWQNLTADGYKLDYFESDQGRDDKKSDKSFQAEKRREYRISRSDVATIY